MSRETTAAQTEEQTIARDRIVRSEMQMVQIVHSEMATVETVSREQMMEIASHARETETVSRVRAKIAVTIVATTAAPDLEVREKPREMAVRTVMKAEMTAVTTAERAEVKDVSAARTIARDSVREPEETAEEAVMHCLLRN